MHKRAFLPQNAIFRTTFLFDIPPGVVDRVGLHDFAVVVFDAVDAGVYVTMSLARGMVTYSLIAVSKGSTSVSVVSKYT